MAKCRCQDSNYNRCGKEMTIAEEKQDGLCSTCADHVWAEMGAGIDEYIWTHEEGEITPRKD